MHQCNQEQRQQEQKKPERSYPICMCLRIVQTTYTRKSAGPTTINTHEITIQVWHGRPSVVVNESIIPNLCMTRTPAVSAKHIQNGARGTGSNMYNTSKIYATKSSDPHIQKHKYYIGVPAPNNIEEKYAVGNRQGKTTSVGATAGPPSSETEVRPMGSFSSILLQCIEEAIEHRKHQSRSRKRLRPCQVTEYHSQVHIPNNHT